MLVHLVVQDGSVMNKVEEDLHWELKLRESFSFRCNSSRHISLKDDAWIKTL